MDAGPNSSNRIAQRIKPAKPALQAQISSAQLPKPAQAAKTACRAACHALRLCEIHNPLR